MKRTIRLNESELRRMISESIKEKLNEGVHRYKGFKCVNVSDDPSFPTYEIVSPDGKTIGSTLFPSEMKEIVDNYIKNGQMNETKLRRIVSESVKKLLKEMNSDYEGNDLDYDSIQMQAMSVIPRMKQNGEDISWRSVAEEMGFRLETLNGEDMELLKDAIEDVMYEDEVDNPYWKEDMEFENDFQNLPYANESKKVNKLTTKILAEVTRRLKSNKKLNEEYYPEDDDMMDDYYYGTMMTFSIEGMFDDLSEETIQNLTNTNEEYCENSNSYCSVMVTKVNVQSDDFGGYDITVEAAVSAPEMPIDAIEEDAEDQIWYWFEDKTGQRAINIQIIDEKEVFDHRTEKYK